MEKSVKVVVINSAERKVYQSTISNYKDIYPLLGESVSCFACPVQFNDSDGLFVDDEGLYNPFEGGFIMAGWSYPICGNGVIIGTDEEGESADCTMSVAEVESQLLWVDKADCEQHRRSALSGENFRVYFV
jgi:hypothetical protein